MTGPTTTQSETEPATSTGPEAGVCGDGVVQTGEHCDDGNVSDEDGCPAMCRFAPGTMLWQIELIGGNVNPLLLAGLNQNALSIDADGTIYATVRAEYPEQDQSARGNVWIAAITSEGEPLWTLERDGLGQPPMGDFIAPDDDARAILALPDGGAISGATLVGADSSYDAWFIKLSASGQIAWETTYGLDELEINFDPNVLLLLPDGFGFFAAGQETPLSGQGKMDSAFALSYDLDGTLTDDRRISVPDEKVYHLDAAVSSDGAIFLLSQVGSSVLTKQTVEGVELWSTPAEEASRVVADQGGGAFLVGLRDAGQGSFHLFMQSYDAEGALLWDSQDSEALSWRALTGVAFEPSQGFVCVHGTRWIDPGPRAELICRAPNDVFVVSASEEGYSGALAVDPLGLLASLVNRDSRYFLQKLAP